MNLFSFLLNIIVIESKYQSPENNGVRQIDRMVDRCEFGADDEEEVEYYELKGVFKDYEQVLEFE